MTEHHHEHDEVITVQLEELQEKVAEVALSLDNIHLRLKHLHALPESETIKPQLEKIHRDTMVLWKDCVKSLGE